MGNINIETVLEYTKDLTILYVEDDLDIQEQTKKIFDNLFKSVTIANDGEQALNIYEKNDFDIIITDVVMPNMNGLELSKSIRDINRNQPIIVISAYNESENLIEFINLNVRQFIQKPILIQNILLTLYTEAKNIFNSMMIDKYRVEIEQSNKENKENTIGFKKVKRILDKNLNRMSTFDISEYEDEDFSKLSLNSETLNELKELGEDISGAILLTELSKNISQSNITSLGNLLLAYAEVLPEYKEYSEIKGKIKLLGNSMINNSQHFILEIENISIFLESLIYVLKMWREKLENKNVKKALLLHTSMINDIEDIVSIIESKEL